MKKIIFSLFISLCSLAAFAQTPQPSVDIENLLSQTIYVEFFYAVGTTCVSGTSSGLVPFPPGLTTHTAPAGMNVMAIGVDDDDNLTCTASTPPTPAFAVTTCTPAYTFTSITLYDPANGCATSIVQGDWDPFPAPPGSNPKMTVQ